MTNLKLNSAHFSDPHSTLVDFNVTLDGKSFDFTYHPDDGSEMTKAIKAQFYKEPIAIGPYVPPQKTPQQVRPGGQGGQPIVTH